MRLFRRHQHEWGEWRYTLMTLTDSPIVEAARQARHCSTCRKIEFRTPGPVRVSTDGEQR